MLTGPIRFITAARRIEDCPDDGLPELVLAGRSNAGKSSLVNALAGQTSLARVSRTPGKTQQLVYFRVRDDWYLTDLPGYGYTASQAARRSFSGLVDHYFSAGRPIRLVLLLMDIRHQPSRDDLGLMHYLDAQGLDYAVVLSKGDKLSSAQRRVRLAAMSRDLPAVPLFAISSSRREGIDVLADWLEEQMAPTSEDADHDDADPIDAP